MDTKPISRIMDKQVIDLMITQALQEDHAGNDITSKILIDAKHHSKGVIITKEPCTICGIKITRDVFKKIDPKVEFHIHKKDTERAEEGEVICSFSGPTQSLLAAERTALNFLGYLSGVATSTHRYVEAVKDTKVKILDTRKTTPNLRMLKKYAVRCGGGENHRFDLNDMVLIKDNHLIGINKKLSLSQAVRLARSKTKKKIEIEVDTLTQLKDALRGYPDYVLLDNMDTVQLRKAVQLTKKLPKTKRPRLEASGGITLKNIHSVAKTGIDRISIGALTHTIKWIDVSMEIN